MTYKIKEIFFTQQGEGTNTGKDFVFVRFSGCNLWSGKEKNRASAICKFCDTDFYGTDGINGGVYSAKELIKRVKLLWLSTSKQIRVLCTGGEPLLQLDSDLISAFKEEGFYIAIETNGAAIRTANILLGAHDNRTVYLTFFDLTAWNRILHGHHNHVTHGSALALGTAQHFNALHALRA